MPTEGVGRLLVASLHQGIAEVLPMRLGFYEHWLNEGGLRDGTIGLPPFRAVMSFLRQEGASYGAVTGRAGQHAADWIVESMSPGRRSIIRAMPMWVRVRVVMRMAERLVRESYRGSRASWTVRRGQVRLQLDQSVFCDVRGPVGHPLCTFYAAAGARLLTHFDLTAEADIVNCRGTGKATCELAIEVAKSPADPAQSSA